MQRLCSCWTRKKREEDKKLNRKQERKRISIVIIYCNCRNLYIHREKFKNIILQKVREYTEAISSISHTPTRADNIYILCSWKLLHATAFKNVAWRTDVHKVFMHVSIVAYECSPRIFQWRPDAFNSDDSLITPLLGGIAYRSFVLFLKRETIQVDVWSIIKRCIKKTKWILL